MSSETTRLLIIGYGNPGRLDDGLGPALAAHFESKMVPGLQVDIDYQLSVEHADQIARHDVVIFADADESGPEPFWFGTVDPEKQVSFSSHSISAEALMEMAGGLLGGQCKGYMLGIRGYQFNEFGEFLSDKAKRNLQSAIDFLEDAIVKKKYDDYVLRYGKQELESKNVILANGVEP